METKPYNGIVYHDYNDLKQPISTSVTFTLVRPENRITSDVMTLYEYTEIISIRSAQIQNGARVYTDVTGISDYIKMAEKEIKNRACPLSIRRFINANEAEDWEVNELTYFAS
jgi:DNA-directed RNA polymerase subunit K/omega